MKQTTLYFGTQKANGTHINAYEFQIFLNKNVTLHFSGFTVIEGIGSWKGQTEHGYIVTILHEGVKVTDKLIDQIRKEYTELFIQESVLRVDIIPENVEF